MTNTDQYLYEHGFRREKATAPDRIWAAKRGDGQSEWSKTGPTGALRQFGPYISETRYREVVDAMKAMADASLGSGAKDDASMAARFRCYEIAGKADELLEGTK